MLNKLLFTFFFVCFGAKSIFAQIKIYPITQKQQQPTNTLQRTAPLNLPFFDDFLGKEIDNNLWQNAGASITNGIAKNPKSRGVVTLDSYKQNGKAYNITSPIAEGYSDTLTSRPIDLSGYSPASNVFLSFFVQEQGLGEQPDNSDFLLLQAKDINNNWLNIWQKNGNSTPTNEFEQVIFPLTNPNFFHVDFQFRFLRYGRISGNFDVWHIDYVYLNHSRNPADTCYPDIATRQSIGGYLKKLSAMPLKHFKEHPNPASLLADTLFFRVKNLSCNFRVINYTAELNDQISNSNLLASLPITAPVSNPFIIFPDDDFVLKVKPQNFSLPPSATKLQLETKLTINVSDGNTVIPPIDFRNNDTIRQVTILDNYYAYDDGEAEYVAGVNQRLGRIAVRFVLPQEAQLSDVDICFLPFIKDMSNQTFVLSVWKKVSGRTQEVLFQKAFPIKYPSQPNGFVRFPVDSFQTLYVKDTIFVGLQQTTDDLLAIGFDANNNSFDEVFYNIAGIWEQESNIRGSLMIRPVFRNDAITALNESPESFIQIFPNPAQNYVQITGISPLRVELYDLQSRKQNFSWDKTTQQLHFNLAKGLYLLKIQDPKGKWWQKKLVVNN